MRTDLATAYPPAFPGLTLDELTISAVAALGGAAAREPFERLGLVRVAGLLAGDPAILAFRSGVVALLRSRLESVGADASGEDLDVLFNRLCALDRRYGAQIYDGCRDLQAFYDIVANDRLRRVCRSILGVEHLHSPFDKAMFRIDRPHEPWYEFHWHQEYPYNLMSRPTITAWTALTDVTAEMGALKVIPGSHRKLEPVKLVPRMRKDGPDPQVLDVRIHSYTDEELSASALDVEMKAGDVLFFHQLLLHRSGRNVSTRSRWAFAGRYGNALDPDLVRRGWQIERTPRFDVLRATHPEAIAAGSEETPCR